MIPAQRRRLAVVCGVAHLWLRISMQAVSVVWYVPAHTGWMALPVLQTQNVLVAAVLASLAWLFAAGRRSRWAIVPIYFFVTVYCLADQVYYKIFLGHIRSTVSESGQGLNIGILARSFYREWDLAFAISAAIASAGLAWLISALLRPRESARLSKAAAAFALVLGLCGIPTFSSTRYFALNEHPLWVAAADRSQRSLDQVLAARAPAVASAGSSAGDRDARLVRSLAASHAVGKRRNVLLIVLESVGARNLLSPKGELDPALTPTIASLAANGILFDNVYAPYPGTVRSWMSLHSGGGNVPMGGYREFRAPYNGPTMPRVFEKLGYASGFFSSQPLEIEMSDLHVAQMGFQTVYDFARDVARNIPAYSNHLWASREEYTLEHMESWIAETAPAGRPFLLEYITGATHYPYGAPADYPSPFQRGYAASDYRNALHYTDHAIGLMLAWLERTGLRRDTVVAITGDHGEAFGESHPGNRGHRDYLYEENVRTFLLLADPAVKTGALVSHRIASNGAILGTLASWVDRDDVHEPNLLAANFARRPAYFYKLLSPEQCGLRDDRWKYIGEIRSKRGELYDLAMDPDENVDVASYYPDRVAAYRAQCAEWMVTTHREYASHVPGFEPRNPKELRPSDPQSAGPTMVAVGRAPDGIFTAAAQFEPDDVLGVWTKWVVAVDASAARSQWTSPSGQEYWAEDSAILDWDEAFSVCPAPRPLAAGEWKVRVWVANKTVLSARFRVRGKARR